MNLMSMSIEKFYHLLCRLRSFLSLSVSTTTSVCANFAMSEASQQRTTTPVGQKRPGSPGDQSKPSGQKAKRPKRTSVDREPEPTPSTSAAADAADAAEAAAAALQAELWLSSPEGSPAPSTVAMGSSPRSHDLVDEPNNDWGVMDNSEEEWDGGPEYFF
ncbi:uncharacterized protein LOC112057023 [Bicyclus anynana]|uniref:Uncharacterized protein LOC112057023 n=1 Tax=Bicyclus anynana TaxID=110368 RepID=A0A6J1P662_BICAN|nr:uncharacterized protein LOC112057023 [Bicyclus anynana]